MTFNITIVGYVPQVLTSQRATVTLICLHFQRRIVSEMTYYVSSETLNSTNSTQLRGVTFVEKVGYQFRRRTRRHWVHRRKWEENGEESPPFPTLGSGRASWSPQAKSGRKGFCCNSISADRISWQQVSANSSSFVLKSRLTVPLSPKSGGNGTLVKFTPMHIYKYCYARWQHGNMHSLNKIIQHNRLQTIQRNYYRKEQYSGNILSQSCSLVKFNSSNGSHLDYKFLRRRVQFG